MGALVDFPGGGGVGKDSETGLGLLCGMTTSFFVPSVAAWVALLLLPEGARRVAGLGLAVVLCLTLFDRPSVVDCLSCPTVDVLLVASGF